MKSKPYKLHGKLFRYDFDRRVVEYISKAGTEEIADEAEWKKKHGGELFGIDGDGYIVLDTVGLSMDNWTNKGAREEYLAEWVFELDEESAALAADFAKYELPYLTGGSGHDA